MKVKLAVISDTHDCRDKILKAVYIMNERNVEALIHCGDYCSPFTKRWFDDLKDNIKENFYGVFGNNDGDPVFLRKNLGQICELVDGSMELVKNLDGKRVFASHMPKSETIEALENSNKFDIILSGHTHTIVNKKNENGVLVVNPGEACGYLTGKATFAIIDTQKMEAEIIEL
ncbi:MAG: metallophosphoesterase [Promethearchaeota archaeon]|nr:MAG: metallophosphoesterase [Candidatus Lokiarchaeota archaeon]